MCNSFNHKYVNSLLQDNAGTGELIAFLSTRFPIPNEHNITHISSEDVIFFSELLEKYSELDVWSTEIEICIQAVFEALRNSMAYNQIGQNLIIEHESILININRLLCTNISMSETLPQICLKFLTNLVIRNKNSAFTVWKHFGITIIHLLQRTNCSEMAVALYYNILLLEPPDVRIDLDILNYICSLLELKEYEIATYCLQNLLLKQDLLLLYNSIEEKYKLIVLRNIQDALNMEINLTKSQLKFIVDIFKDRCPCLVSFYINRDNRTSDVQALETIYLVNILGALTSIEKNLIALQEDRHVFIDTFLLLKSVHDTGKMYDNIFTPINKLGNAEGASFMKGPQELLGFKSTLIRIIANLCNNHKINQEEIRKHNGIGLILDCCSIDSKNPYVKVIMQWAIYAIRNICKNNQENQNHISSMKMQSGSYSKTLNEMGIMLCNE